MSKSLFLGVDIGTYEAKGILCDHAGKIIGMAARQHEMIVPRPGFAEHRANEDWWQGFVAVTRSVIEQTGVSPSDIKAVCTSAIGPCMLPVDQRGEPLCNGVLYGVDTRSTLEIADLTVEIGEDRIIAFNGNALNSQAVGPKILWLRRNCPEIFAKAHMILSSTPFITHKLTGNYVIDHYTAVNFTPLYDSDALNWSDELHRGIVGLDKLPSLAWSTDIAGTITADASRATGLVEGTPVAVGTIDAAAEALSVGVQSLGDLMVMYGSTMFFVAIAAQRNTDPRLFYAPWLFPNEHALLAGLATSGTITQWFRNNFAEGMGRSDAFARLTREAATSPKGARGLIVLPYFSGERTPIHDPDAKGCIFGLNLTHGRADIFRAILEGIAYSACHVFETYEEAGTRPSRLFAVGGGTRNSVWLGAVSDISGYDQILRETTVGASYGDAFLAAVSVGAVERTDIAKWNRVARRVRAAPDPAYESGFRKFKELYQSTRHLMRAE